MIIIEGRPTTAMTDVGEPLYGAQDTGVKVALTINTNASPAPIHFLVTILISSTAPLARVASPGANATCEVGVRVAVASACTAHAALRRSLRLARNFAILTRTNTRRASGAKASEA